MRATLGRAWRGTAAIAAALLVGSAVLTSASPAAAYEPQITDPPDDRIVVEVITVNGSGCPAGTAAIAVAPDNTAFTVTYSQYIALVGVGSTPIDFRKNCQLNVLVHVPQGFTYAIAKADYRGFASLARGANAMLKANYYFQGHSQTEFRTHRLDGEYEDNWQATDQTEIPALVYKPCGEQRLLNINTELRVNKGTSDTRNTTSLITMDSTDGSLDTVYHFHWKSCP
ncbi:MAG TPA: DUF4360 domain-containing protein [Pilimelia sp.]|nr:DUF4360 domain-containing protein [Pilimelia sp.]